MRTEKDDAAGKFLCDAAAWLVACSRFRPDMVLHFDPPLDKGIARYVYLLREAGFETFESCEGGNGHACQEPTVRFHGDESAGFRALGAAFAAELPVAELRRVWPVNDRAPTGPWWELVFSRRAG